MISPRSTQKRQVNTMPTGGGKSRKTKPEATPTVNQTEESILNMVEEKMTQVFEVQYEELKDKLITLMAKEISKLKERVVNIEEEFQSFKDAQIQSAIASAENTQESQAQQIKQQKRMDAFSENITRISNQLNNAEVEIDDNRQLLKERNIRVVGLPERDLEEPCNLKEMVVEFSEHHLKITDLGKDDIEEIHRMGQKNDNKPRDIIIKFKERGIRNKFYNHRRNLYDHATRKSSTDVYINEDLTQYRQRLYYDTRKLRNRSAIHAVWTSSGTIMVKLEESSTPVPIKTHRELANLLRENNVEV